MARSSDRRIFVDTNVLVYAAVRESPWHGICRKRLAEYYASGVELWISRQVMREYMATLTRPQTYARSQPVSAITQDMGRFEKQFHIAEDGPIVMSKLLELINRFSVGGKQIHDANIVATMLAYDVPELLTHNTADFERFVSLIGVLPVESDVDD